MREVHYLVKYRDYEAAEYDVYLCEIGATCCVASREDACKLTLDEAVSEVKRLMEENDLVYYVVPLFHTRCCD